MKKLILLLMTCISISSLSAQSLIPAPVEQSISDGLPFALSDKTHKCFI